MPRSLPVIACSRCASPGCRCRAAAHERQRVTATTSSTPGTLLAIDNAWLIMRSPRPRSSHEEST
eukprot:4818788-Prymnesium_polylepis.2